jgi:hypothetical protein
MTMFFQRSTLPSCLLTGLVSLVALSMLRADIAILEDGDEFRVNA